MALNFLIIHSSLTFHRSWGFCSHTHSLNFVDLQERHGIGIGIFCVFLCLCNWKEIFVIMKAWSYLMKNRRSEYFWKVRKIHVWMTGANVLGVKISTQKFRKICSDKENFVLVVALLMSHNEVICFDFYRRAFKASFQTPCHCFSSNSMLQKSVQNYSSKS